MKTLNKTERAVLALEGRFLESEAPNDAAREIPVLIIKEGMGNKADKHFYSAELLERVCSKFDGVKCYADHQTKNEETDQPERSIRKLVGYYQAPHIVVVEGKKAIAATLKVIEGKSYDWAWDLVKEAAAFAKKFKNKELVGVSINAWGRSHEVETTEGIINAVDDFSEVQSADIVTQAGAGGGFRLKEAGRSLREAVKKALHREAESQGDKTMNADALKNLGEGLKTLHDQIKGNPEHAQAYGPAMEALMGHHAEMLKADAPAAESPAADEKVEAPEEAKKEADRQAELVKDFDKMTEAYKAGKMSPVEKALFETILTDRAEKKVRENKASIEKAIRESGIPAAYASDLPLLCAGKSDEEIKTLVEARKSLVSMTGDRATGAGEGGAKGGSKGSGIGAKLAASGIKMKEVKS